MSTRSATPTTAGESGAPQSSAPGATARRIAAIDLFRGLAILEVVLHHVSGGAIRAAEAGSTLHQLLLILNRTLHFAVPAFLFMTAVVLTRSALKRFDARRYYWGRVKKSLVPYVLWTVLYVLFRVATEQDPASVLTRPERWQVWLQYGKGYFHLYFLLIALQFYLILPLLLPIWRRRSSFALVALAAFALQVLVYYLNRGDILNFRYPGTMVVWYIPAITLGMYFGANYAQFEAFWRRYRVFIAGTALAALTWYVPIAVNALQGVRVSTVSYSLGHWVYTTAMALTLFGVAHSLTRGPQWLQRPLGHLGTVSLQVYLLHPMLLFYLNRVGYPGQTWAFVLTFVAYAVIAVGLPFAFARLLQGTKLSLWLFGR